MSAQASSFEPTVLEGFLSVNAALNGQSRRIYELWIAEGKKEPKVRNLVNRAKFEGIAVRTVSAETLATKAEGRTHGGVLAFVGARKTVTPLELMASLPAQKPAFLALLEGIEDPYNFGACVRSLYAAGAQGLLLPARNWMSAAGTVARASAGASELIPTAVYDDASEVHQAARLHGVSMLMAGRGEGSVSLYEADLTVPLLLCVGGENRGLSRAVADACVQQIYIPYGSDFRNSLSAAGATAAFAFEILRQRLGK